MGISGQPENLLNVELVKRDNIPVIRRFSGGGTVIVDEETLFVTFIFSKGSLDIAPFPESIMRWSADLYASSWQIPGFFLRENDYVIGDKKCGGNAQYIKKDRWLHHTSFLWDYKPGNMEYLQLPMKRPKYREDRSHQEFLCCLKNYQFDSLRDLSSDLVSELVKRFYIEFSDVRLLKSKIHRVSTCRI